MLITTRLCAALFEATARSAMVEHHDGIPKYEGPELNGAGQDIAMEDIDVDSSGIHLDANGDPPLP